MHKYSRHWAKSQIVRGLVNPKQGKAFTVMVSLRGNGSKDYVLIIFNWKIDCISPRIIVYLRIPNNIRVFANKTGYITKERLQ